jgi:type I restriction enzyme, S subunit
MMEFGRVGDYVEGVKTWNPKSGTGEFSYVDIASVNNLTKQISAAVQVECGKAPSRARQLIAEGDILVSTVRPVLNAVAAVPAALDGATASTGFCVLRPGPQIVSRYLYHWVRTPAFVQSMVRLATGQAYPAVSDRIVKASSFPIVSVAEQRRVASVLDQVDTLRRAGSMSIDSLRVGSRELFLDLFGDPVVNPHKWPLASVEDVAASVSYGTSQKASLTGDIPVLRMNNITASGEIDLADLKYMQAREVAQNHLVQAGDVLFNRTNSPELVGKTALYRGNDPLAYAGYLIRVRFGESIDPEYFAAFMNLPSTKILLRNMCKTIIGMANINATQLKSIRLPVPPMPRQQEFVERIGVLEGLKSVGRRRFNLIDELFSSLQYRAFRGEL